VTVGLDVIDHLTGGRIGTFDIPCPTCGPYKRSARNQRRPVLRVYRLEPNFAGYHCARCGDKGAALHGNGTPPDPMKLAKARAEAAERERIVKADRLGLAASGIEELKRGWLFRTRSFPNERQRRRQLDRKKTWSHCSPESVR
jgi:hypothetical protein